MIKQIVFDCNGVLAILDFEAYMSRVSGDPAMGKILVERLWIEGSPWLEYDRGRYTKEEMPEILAEYLPEIPIETIRVFLDGWAVSLTPIEGMEEIVQELQAAGYPCYLLSNFNSQFEELRPFHPAIKALDGEVISYNIDMLKPDREIFDYTAQKFDFEPAETLFIDDTLENVEGAIAAGWHAYQFTDTTSFRRALVEMNILDV